MKIVWLAPEPPLPPLTGGRERVRRMLGYLARQHEIHLVTFAEAGSEAALAGLRLLDVTVTTVSYPHAPGRYSRDMRRAVDMAGKGVFHVQGLEMWRYRRRDCPAILDLHDVPSVLAERLAALAPRAAQRLGAWRQRRQQKRIHALEGLACGDAAVVIVSTERDRQLLREQHPGLAHTIVVPNGIHLADWRFSDHEPDRPTILFPAALNWPVNVDAARLLIERVLPRVAADVPDVKVIIAGHRPDQALVYLAKSNPAVTLLPDPVAMQPLFDRATVVAVPLRVATGSRLKILQALATGRPVVSTPIGASGLDLTPDHHLEIAPLLAPFTQKLTHLLVDRDRRRHLRTAGRAAVERHDWHRYLPQLDIIYTE